MINAKLENLYHVTEMKQSNILNFNVLVNSFKRPPVKIASGKEILVDPKEDKLKVKFDIEGEFREIPIFKEYIGPKLITSSC